MEDDDLQSTELRMLEYYRARAPLLKYENLSPETTRVLQSYGEYFGRKLAGRSVLEVACGTGFWTLMLAQHALEVVATDAAPEMLSFARARSYPRSNVELSLCDAYSLGGLRRLFGGGFHFQWVSHVPRSRLSEFFQVFHERMAPGAIVVFGDNKDQGDQADAEGNLYQERTLPDGSRHRVIKNWPKLEELRKLLSPYSQQVELEQFEKDWFVCYTRS
jgi:SAM-dependent methyltransferase